MRSIKTMSYLFKNKMHTHKYNTDVIITVVVCYEINRVVSLCGNRRLGNVRSGCNSLSRWRWCLHKTLSALHPAMSSRRNRLLSNHRSVALQQYTSSCCQWLRHCLAWSRRGYNRYNDRPWPWPRLLVLLRQSTRSPSCDSAPPAASDRRRTIHCTVLASISSAFLHEKQSLITIGVPQRSASHHVYTEHWTKQCLCRQTAGEDQNCLVYTFHAGGWMIVLLVYS